MVFIILRLPSSFFSRPFRQFLQPPIPPHLAVILIGKNEQIGFGSNFYIFSY